MKTFIGAGLFILCASLYIFTRAEVHTFDALSYTQDVENKPFIELYHPHHLLYGPVGRLTVNLAALLGYDGRADQPIQLLNALAGALGVLLMWMIAQKWGASPILGLIPASLMALSYAYWLYAGEVEVYTFAALFICGILYSLPSKQEGSKPSPTTMGVLIGFLHVGAVMFHQTNILFVLPLGLFLLLDDRRLLLPYALSLGLGVGIPYLAVGYASGFRDVESYYHWLTGYAQTGAWGGNISGAGLEALWAGWQQTISPQKGFAYPVYGIGLGALVWQWRRISVAWRAFLLAWLLLYGLFFWWWEPWNIEFWIALLPFWALCFCLALPALQAFQSWSLGAAFLFFCALGAANYHQIQQNNDPQKDYYRLMTEALAPMLAPSDVVVTRGNILDLYLPFYAQHENLISLRTLPEPLPNLLSHPYLRGQIIFIDALVLDEARHGQENPFGLSMAEIAQIQADYPLLEAVQVEGQRAFYSIGKRISSPPWHFEHHLNGWLEFGAENLRFEGGSWCITGGADPWIESPPLRLQADSYLAFVVEMRAEADSQAQIFWARQGEGLDEARSVKFAVLAGPQRYEIDLSEQADWSGEIVFLRFDPLAENTNIGACLSRIDLVEG